MADGVAGPGRSSDARSPGRAFRWRVIRYAGFALFVGGIALGMLGLFLFVWAGTTLESGRFFWQVRAVAIALPAIGLPAFLLSLVVLLPVGRRAVYGGVVGTVGCLAAVGLFVWAYPYRWDVVALRGYSRLGLALYATGLAILVGSTGAGLATLIGPLDSSSGRSVSGVPGGRTEDTSERHRGDRAGGAGGTAGKSPTHPEQPEFPTLDSDRLRALFREHDAERRRDS